MINTPSLADFQQDLFYKVSNNQPITNAEIKRLKGSENTWINVARIVAPNNLVIRQYVLKDYLIYHSPHSYSVIMDMLRKLTFYRNGAWRLLFGESYSYWQYCKPFLVLYCSKFSSTTTILKEFIEAIDMGFQATAYLRGSTMYPAPFGDLRDEPLEIALQDPSKMAENTDVLPVKKRRTMDNVVEYTIKGIAVGYNGHAQLNNSTCTIVNGIPTPFTWYVGYKNKYPNWYSEALTMANPKRLLSLYRILF